ncbi:MAG: hypothetical protein IJ328_06740 [Muribaculaceae bacterium]|nr:hypothetical protein [Muribaculaceae bacterium]
MRLAILSFFYVIMWGVWKIIVTFGELNKVEMNDIWDILVPIMVIGGIFVSVFAENRKKSKTDVPIPQPQRNRESEKIQNTEDSDLPCDLGIPQVFMSNESPDIFKSEKSKDYFPPAPSPVDKQGKGGKVLFGQPLQQAEDDAYSEDTDKAGEDALSDMRRAVIAHELLKRKF